jgi:hypothetical protein
MRYTACRTLGLLALAKRIMEEEGVTLRRAAERLQVCHSLFESWQRQQAVDVNNPILAMLKSKRKATCAGPVGQLKPFENAVDEIILTAAGGKIAVMREGDKIAAIVDVMNKYFGEELFGDDRDKEEII